MRFFFAGEFAPPAWARTLIQSAETLFDEAFARAFDRGLTRVEGDSNLVVRETISGLEQDAGACHFACRWFATANEME